MSNKIIETFNISKVFKLKGKNKTIKALDDVNIHINEGEIFALLGPNGAGKTTLIQILITLLHPTEGYALVDGHNILDEPIEAKRNVSLMLDSKMLYYRITAYDNLKFFCKIYKVPYNKQRIYEAAKFFGLENWLDQYVENFSGGMKMKLALCRTFLLNRPILFLDEPTLGLDVKLKRDIVKRIKKLNKTILLTSHDMGVVEELCDRVAFINKGKIIRVGTKEDIKRFEEEGIKLELRVDKNQISDLFKDLKYQNYVYDVNKNGRTIKFSLQKRRNYKELLKTLSNYDILRMTEREQNLEDLFFELNK
jgi:ABC-2 type transport system ATP-binding protein